MIEIDVDRLDWKGLEDEERVQLCDMMISEFERLIPLFKDFAYNYVANRNAALMIHDFLRVRTNCRMYAHDQAERNLSLMWQSFMELRKICYHLEFIVNPGIEAMIASGYSMRM